MTNPRFLATTTTLPELMSRMARSAIGSDQLFSGFDYMVEGAQSFPPYNLEKFSDDSYRLTFAVAGFSRDELEVSVADSHLVVEGRKVKEETKEEDSFIHRGIAFRDFKRTFKLMEYVVVDSSSLENGLLTITLRRELPEAMKPRTIEIK